MFSKFNKYNVTHNLLSFYVNKIDLRYDVSLMKLTQHV